MLLGCLGVNKENGGFLTLIRYRPLCCSKVGRIELMCYSLGISR